jgi:CheY-like chemotaxis protein
MKAMSTAKPIILCVDDDARTLEIITKVLSRLPVVLHSASHPHQALDLARQAQPHLIVLDLMMPDMTGWELLAEIRQGPHHPDLRILVLTAKGSGAERVLATNVARVDRFMTKPFDTSELAHAVSELLDLPPQAAAPARAARPSEAG